MRAARIDLDVEVDHNWKPSFRIECDRKLKYSINRCVQNSNLVALVDSLAVSFDSLAWLRPLNKRSSFAISRDFISVELPSSIAALNLLSSEWHEVSIGICPR